MQELGNLVKDLFEHYRQFQQTNPNLSSIVNSMLTAELIFPAADVVSQLITEKKIRLKKVVYKAALAPLYGIFLYGLIQSKKLPAKYTDNKLLQAMFGPNLWGNLNNLLFFVNDAIGEKFGYSLQKLAHHYLNLFSDEHKENHDSVSDKKYWTNFKRNFFSYVDKKEYLKTVALTLTLWNVFQCWNLNNMPEPMQVQTTLVAAFFYTIYQSALSLKSGRKLMHENYYGS